MLPVVQLVMIQQIYGGEASTKECDFSTGPCSTFMDRSNVMVTLDINPKPLTVMKELQFTVWIRKGEVPTVHAAVEIDLTMPGMYMGENRITLAQTKDNSYTGSGIIPMCSSGSHTWIAEVTVKADNSVHSARYIFNLN